MLRSAFAVLLFVAVNAVVEIHTPEAGIPYEKDKELNAIWQFPPYRLLAKNLILSHWVGWQCPGKHSVSGWRRIETVYDNGHDSYVECVKDQDA